MVIQRSWRDFRACTAARLEALQVVWQKSVDRAVAKEKRSCDILDETDRRRAAEKTAARKDKADKTAAARRDKKARKAKAEDEEREQRFREVASGMREMKTRLKKADALVRVANGAAATVPRQRL